MTLLAVSAALLAARLWASTRVGFGDAEALYATYALHPQPAYLDHPGLIGLAARAIGNGDAPSPERAHLATAALATLVPWEMALACRACGAPWRRCLSAAFVVALVPAVAIGLFAMTPDLLLMITWTGSLALAALALRSPVGGPRASLAFALAGVLAGMAAAAKVTGALLLVSLAVAYASRASRAHARTIAPWAGIVAGLVVVAPIVAFEVRSGAPMVHHRLVDTQQAAGLSLRNAGALVGGQLAYLSPLVVWLAALAARASWRDRGDAVGTLLWVSCVVPAGVLVPLSLWSRIAEPHWIAPALLSLVPAMTRARGGPPRQLVLAASVLAATMVAVAHAWVLVPDAPRLAPASYDARLDLANELYGWPQATRAVRDEIASEWTPGDQRGDVAVVGPHWVICAQLAAALGRTVPVGCNTPVPDDFDGWWPRDRWRDADSIVWVTDERFGPPPELPSHAAQRTRRIPIERAGRTVRVFTIVVLTRRARA